MELRGASNACRAHLAMKPVGRKLLGMKSNPSVGVNSSEAEVSIKGAGRHEEK